MIPISKPFLDKKEQKAVIDVLNSGTIASGPKVKIFEEKFAKFCGTKYAVAANNGTSALHMALKATGIKSGDEVITSPFTFAATANSISMQGAKPVFADIEEDYFTIDPREIEKKITSKTRAILTVDLYGQCCDYDKIEKIAKKNNLILITDSCQAHGASYFKRKIGSIGNAAAFSFYATKNLATGEGGMITTNDKSVADEAKQFRNHGQSERYDYVELGFNYRMTDIQAAIGITQLEKLSKFIKIRQKNAAFYLKNIKNKNIILPKIRDGCNHVFHQFTLRIKNRENLISLLQKNGIGYGVYYPKPLHLYSHFKKIGYNEGDFPVSEKIAKEVLSIPVHPLVSEKDLKKITSVLENFK